MTSNWHLFIALLCIALTVGTPAMIVIAEDHLDAAPPAASGELTRLAIRGAHFVPNQGQWRDESVIYAFRSQGMDIAFRRSSLTMHLRRAKIDSNCAGAETLSRDEHAPSERSHLSTTSHAQDRNSLEDIEYEFLTLTVAFPGSNPVLPSGIDEQITRFNYFVGDDDDDEATSTVRADVPSFAGVVYENIYDGIDLHILGSDDGVLKYEFHCAPESDHTQVQIHYDGIDALRIDQRTGDLLIATTFGTLRDGAPLVWQEDSLEPSPSGRGQGGPPHSGLHIPAHFIVIDANTYTFNLISPADSSRPLIIDPEVDWMTYLGGTNLDQSGLGGVAADSAGNAVVTGLTWSTDFEGRNNTYHGGESDAFVLRVSSSGKLQWMTYLGGTDDDRGCGVAVDSAGNALVTGETQSIDFAGRNNSHHGGHRDAFALKVSPSGQLQWMTYLGGSGIDNGYGLSVDSGGNALVTGETQSIDFAGRNNSHHGGHRDAFALKVSPSGQLQWMTYLGGNGELDVGGGIALDSAGNALVAGLTTSSDFAGRNNSYYGGFRDAFALKVSPSGQLQWMTYLGGSSVDVGRDIAVDSAGNALVTGSTDSTNFAGRNNSYYGDYDSFALKVSPSGQLQWMTYLGGTDGDHGSGVAADSGGNALVTGSTYSTDFEGRTNTNHGDLDAFALKVSSSGIIQWMTYLGGSGADDGSGIAVDSAGNALVTGITQSTDFAGRNNSYHGGTWDAFVVKIPAEITLHLHIVSPPIINGEASSDPFAYGASSFPPLVGYAADGVTRIVARAQLPAAGSVTFKLRDEHGSPSADVGTIRRLDGSGANASEISVSTVNIEGQDWAFAILQSPLDFARDSNDYAATYRLIQLTTEFTPKGGGGVSSETLNIQLHRPPVMLLHGLWSGPETWVYDFDTDPRFFVFLGKHDGESGIYANTSVTKDIVDAARQRFVLEKNVAATQVDCIGHSMGGLLLRLYAGEYWPEYPYYRSDNFGEGDINRLITVDTPHMGARLAEWLVYGNNLATPLGEVFEFFSGLRVDGGAVRDMRRDSEVLLNITAAPIPSHAIAGKGGSDLYTAGLLNFVTGWPGTLLGRLQRIDDAIPGRDLFGELFSPNFQGDIVVSRVSQSGRLSGTNTSIYSYSSVTPLAMAIHTSVTKEDRINDRLIDLLNARTTDSVLFAPEFPSAFGFSGEDPLPPFPDLGERVEGLAISDPVGGGIVQAGSNVQVTVDVINGFAPGGVVISSQYDSMTVEEPPYIADLDVPLDQLGPFEIRAFAIDASLDYAEAKPVVLTIETSASLISIRSEPASVYLFDVLPEATLRIQGLFDDQVERDVSGSALGTTYESANPQIATVDAEGIVRGICVGATFITIRNGAIETSAAVSVVSTPAPVQIQDVTIVFGSLSGGEVPDLCTSDNQYVSVRSQFGFSAAEPNIAELFIGAISDAQKPSSLDISIESRISDSGGTATVKLRNWKDNVLETIHTYPTTQADALESINDLSAANRVRASDGRIEVAIRHSVIATFSATGFESFFDWVEININ